MYARYLLTCIKIYFLNRNRLRVLPITIIPLHSSKLNQKIRFIKYINYSNSCKRCEARARELHINIYVP